MRSFLADYDAFKGQSPTSAILKVAGSAFPSLWTGLSEALSVVEGDVGGTEPDRFGALLRGYLAYLHLADDSEEHYKGKQGVVPAPDPELAGVVWCLDCLLGVSFSMSSFFANSVRKCKVLSDTNAKYHNGPYIPPTEVVCILLAHPSVRDGPGWSVSVSACFLS